MYDIIQELSTSWEKQDTLQLDDYIHKLNKAMEGKKIVCIAAGRMGYAIKAFAMRLMHIGLQSYFIGDTNLPHIASDSIVIIASVSGQTASNILYASQAKEFGSTVFLITQNPSSTLAKLADHVLCINCQESSQIMKSLAEQYTFLLYDYIIASLIELRQLPHSLIQSNHSVLE